MLGGPLLAAALLAGCGGGGGAGDGPGQPIAVMTRNLYLGADLSPLFFALTVDDLTARASDVWRQIYDSRFDERAQSLAAEIAQGMPDVVSLQEVSLFRSQTPGDWRSGAAPDASKVDLDFLEILLDALETRGAAYQVAASGIFTDQELPALAADATPFDARLSDRNVILVRQGLGFASGPAAPFSAATTLPVGGAGGTTLTLQRGFVSADVTVGTKTVRVVDAHLEVGGPLGRTQEAQARELLAALGPFSGPLILAGDFNSPADGSDTASYVQLTTEGPSGKAFRDAWRAHPAPGPASSIDGGTCCLDLADPGATAAQRIDLVLCRGAVQPVDAAVIAPEQTPSGLWPSDHLGLLARLQLQ